MLITSTILPNFNMTSFRGWQPKKSQDKAVVYQMADIIKGKDIDTIAVSGHTLPDGDSIFSCLACASLLHEVTNKNVDVYLFDKMPEQYKFLTEKFEGIRIIEVNPNTNLDKKYDLCVSVDTSANNLIDEKYYNDIFKKAKHTLKIDHHPGKIVNNDSRITVNYADLNYTDPNCISASEVLMQFVKPLGLNPSKLPKTFTEGVYCGLLSDSNDFEFVNHPMVFNDAHLLLTKGINHKELLKSVFEKKEPGQNLTKFYDVLSSKLQFSDNGKISYLIIDDEFDEYIRKAEEETDKATVMNTMKKVIRQSLENNNAEIGFYTSIIKENSNTEKIAVSIQSNVIPVNAVASKFGGGGHKNAAGLYGPSQGKTVKEWAEDFLRELLPLTE